MDEFAQTRAPDDLFDDDFTPIPEPVTQIDESPHLPQASTSRSVQRDRSSQIQPAQQSRLHEGNQKLPKDTKSGRPTETSSKLSAPLAHTPEVTAAEDGSSATKAEAQTNAPIGTDTIDQRSISQARPSSAVRGDRTATGGVVKPKLTEEELSAKLAAVRLNNAKISEAHRLAEADEANFHQREAKAKQKRVEEGAARRAMNSEREKNRMRKLGAQAGREWDEGKEDQIVERGSQFRRGAHGGVAFSQGSAHSGYDGPVSERGPGQSPRGRPPRGRGGRGDRSRGGGRGGMVTSEIAKIQAPPDPRHDFPALPSASKSGDWAEEMQEAKSP